MQVYMVFNMLYKVEEPHCNNEWKNDVWAIKVKLLIMRNIYFQLFY